MGKTLLVVEDDDDTRESLAALLRAEGYAVVTAEHGQAALDYLGSHPAPGLILLAMLMPVLDGWQFLERRARLPRLAAVPVVITTGTVLNRQWALGHGCAGLVR